MAATYLTVEPRNPRVFLGFGWIHVRYIADIRLIFNLALKKKKKKKKKKKNIPKNFQKSYTSDTYLRFLSSLGHPRKLDSEIESLKKQGGHL